MDVERAETPFVPIRITLRSQAEVDTLALCLALNRRAFDDLRSDFSAMEKAAFDETIHMLNSIRPFASPIKS